MKVARNPNGARPSCSSLVLDPESLRRFGTLKAPSPSMGSEGPSWTGRCWQRLERSELAPFHLPPPAPLPKGSEHEDDGNPIATRQ